MPGQGQTGIVIGPAIGIVPGAVNGGNPGTSIQIVCPALSPPANGIRSGNCDRATLGTICLFSCLPGFVLSGYPIMTCGPTGQWAPQVPPMCLNQPPVYPPVYPPGIPGNNGDGGGTVTISTMSPPVITTMPPMTMPMPTTARPVQLTCPPLLSPPNGLAQGNCVNARPGSQSCFFSCFRGFVLTGLPVLNCLSTGQWSSPPPSCRGTVPYRIRGFRGGFGCCCRPCFK